MARATSLLLAGFLALIATPSTAAISAADLDMLGLKIWQVRAAFHNVTSTLGDPVAEQQLQELIAAAEQVMTQVRDSAESDAEQAQVEQLAENWETYLSLAGQNTAGELGYTDHYTIIDLESSVLALSESLAAQRQQLSGSASDLLAIAIDLQHIASEYMFIASSPDGGSATMGSASDESRLEFVEAVPALDAKLKAALQKWQGNADVLRELQSVNTKWGFIRESLVKFYENAVPFLVKRYSTQMVDSLLMAAEFAEG